MKRCIFLLASVAMAAPIQAQSIATLNAQQAQVEKQKAELQSQINKLNTQISQQESNRKDVLDDLRQSESAISDMSRKLDRLLDREQEAKEDLAAVREEEKTQQQILNEQIGELSDQLFNLYVSGVSPWSALLSGKDAQKISRDLSYLGYISKARAKTVNALNKEIARLNTVKKKVQDKQRNLTQLTKDAKKAKANLEKEQKNYQAKLKKIEGDIKSRRQQAGQLKADDARLTQIIVGIENNIRTQREALRQAEIKRQQQAEERRKAIAAERERKAAVAMAQAKAAQEQAARAKALREQARKAQLEAIAKQREAAARARAAQDELKKAQNEFNLGSLTVAQQEQAKAKLQAALTQQKQLEQSLKRTEQSLAAARQQAENAEIERAKARIAQEKAREAQQLLSKAKEDERLAQQASSGGGSNGLSRGAPWPLRGSLAGRFGQTRPDTGDAWRGILINASEGAPVKAVASGQVVFSNWVRGFGNLIIVDHGNNYLSIYGYNQSLSRSVGDSVKAGQVIARAGSTGGRVEPGLYFEIRRGSQALDPLQWLAR
ncbi:peptidoglycan DD-metalloendopeptidase family protein [Pelistega suis]|uniref:peptidoglycan DD-metalloendopeptidase family protein n=1 Tax=Pelistega suis TaxID=1631957 RepID=UPI00211C6766|nr:peptidoglycan DD-metalloendopeptidase family protein [Pelistega suis]